MVFFTSLALSFLCVSEKGYNHLPIHEKIFLVHMHFNCKEKIEVHFLAILILIIL